MPFICLKRQEEEIGFGLSRDCFLLPSLGSCIIMSWRATKGFLHFSKYNSKPNPIILLPRESSPRARQLPRANRPYCDCRQARDEQPPATAWQLELHGRQCTTGS